MTGVVVQVSVSAGGVPNRAIHCGAVTLGGIAGDGWRHPPKDSVRLRTWDLRSIPELWART